LPEWTWNPNPGKEVAAGIKSKGVEATDALKKTWQETTPTTVEDLVAKAPADQAALASVATAIAQKYGVLLRNPGTKTRESLDKKLGRGREVKAVTDAVRLGFDVERADADPAKVDQIIAELGTHFAIGDEGWAKTPDGYVDRKVMVRFDDGVVGEVQFWPPGLYKAKADPGEGLYKQAQALPNGDPQKNQLIMTMAALYGGVVAALPYVWKAALGSLGT
jgi:hypothetical protein